MKVKISQIREAIAQETDKQTALSKLTVSHVFGEITDLQYEKGKRLIYKKFGK
jgi:hypothetical protein